MTEHHVDRRDFIRLLGAGGAGLALGGCVGEPEQPSRQLQEGSGRGSIEGGITYWNHFVAPNQRQALDAIVAGFIKQHPDAKVRVESIPNDEFMTKFTTAAQSRSGPDTSMVVNQRLPDMLAMNGLVDLTERVDEQGGRPEVAPGIRDAFTVDGKVYALPFFMFVDWMYVRTDWLAEAGITQLPRTWSEFRNAAIAMTDPSKNRYGFGMRGGPGGGEHMIKVMQSFNGAIVTPDRRPALAEEAAVEAFRFYGGLFTTDKVSPPSAPNDSYNQLFQSFKAGRTGMVLHHTGSLLEVQGALKPGEQFGTAIYPKADHESTWILPLGNGLTHVDNGDAAFAWVKTLADPKTQLEWLKRTGYWPAASETQNDPFITENPIYATGADAVRVGTRPTFFPGFQAWQDEVVLVELQKVLIGHATPEQAAKAVVAGLRAAAPK